MRRLTHLPRSGWQARVESVGLPHHTTPEGAPYWDESASYVLSAAEVDALEAATEELHARCLDAVAHVVSRNRWAELAIPAEVAPLVARSWEAREPSLYGRFDLAYDGHSPPRLLEYNADTPTALVEAAVAQWYWLQDVDQAADQFNSIHERLVAAWPGVVSNGVSNASSGGAAGAAPGPVHFAYVDDPEDQATVAYLRDTAEQAGLATRQLLVSEVGWDARGRRFVGLGGEPIRTAFKLYPWEWMAREAFAPHLVETGPGSAAPTRWVEPAWKMVLSNKGILPILWELFPDHPNLLEASFDEWRLEAYARKPLLSREGANVSLVMFGEELARSEGDYGLEGYVYQAIAPLPRFDGRTPVFGSWVVAGQAAGVGIRESDGPITTNTSRFVPHRME